MAPVQAQIARMGMNWIFRLGDGLARLICGKGTDSLRPTGSGNSPTREGWPSGLRRTPGKRVGVKAPPGFESPSLRHITTLKYAITCQQSNARLGFLRNCVKRETSLQTTTSPSNPNRMGVGVAKVSKTDFSHILAR